ncbi:MAG: ATP-binding protein [Pseudomonadales bacterium]
MTLRLFPDKKPLLNRTQTPAAAELSQQDKLLAELAPIKQRLVALCQAHDLDSAVAQGERPTMTPSSETSPSLWLDKLCDAFALGPFERQLLLLCAGMELDPQWPGLCAQVSAGQQTYPTLNLALCLFPGDCSALSPAAPLVYWQLLQVDSNADCLVAQVLRLTPWTLFYLTGQANLDEALLPGLVALGSSGPGLASQQTLAQQIIEHFDTPASPMPVVQLLGDSPQALKQVAALAARIDQRPGYGLQLSQLPSQVHALDRYRRLLERELLLQSALCYIDCSALGDGTAAQTMDDACLLAMLEQLLEGFADQCLLGACQPVLLPNTPIRTLQLPPPKQDEQIQLWGQALGYRGDTLPDALQTQLADLSRQFSLSGQQIHTVAHTARQDCDDLGDLHRRLWQHSRQQSQQALYQLARVIPPGDLDWADIILAEGGSTLLKVINTQVQQRQQVYQNWGFAQQDSYGLGIGALFVGSSGTGKTLAARIIASRLQLDLYHIDLSTVVDKYIGETEKNLEKIFRAAEDSGAILLFDEADALFGKRSKVQDSRDRYANMGVSYLLQRMEAYSGLSILTTNLKNAMDDAFLRRLRFIVQFSFPDAAQRQKIWRRMFPDNAPTGVLDYAKLARLNLAGGSIRNIVLHAAFAAAAAQQAIDMAHLLHATRHEFIKTEKTLTEGLVKDWVE